MRSSIRDLFKYKATENCFFRETRYEGKAREHAKLCIRCWLDQRKRRTQGKHSMHWRAEMNKFFRQRRIHCPHITRKKVKIPWGRNRKKPPEGCIRIFEHAMVRNPAHDNHL